MSAARWRVRHPGIGVLAYDSEEEARVAAGTAGEVLPPNAAPDPDVMSLGEQPHDGVHCHASGRPHLGPCCEPVVDESPWRTGRKVGRTLYRQAGPEPSLADVPIGMLDTPELAAQVVADHRHAVELRVTRDGASAAGFVAVSRDEWAEIQRNRAELEHAVYGLADTANRLHAQVAAYENAITWDTACMSCATVLDSSIQQTERAEQAEVERDQLREAVGRVRALADRAAGYDFSIDWEQIHEALDRTNQMDGAT